MNNRMFAIAWLGVFMLFIIGNHATKCTDVLLYDLTLIFLLIHGLVLAVEHATTLYKLDEKSDKTGVLSGNSNSRKTENG